MFINCLVKNAFKVGKNINRNTNIVNSKIISVEVIGLRLGPTIMNLKITLKINQGRKQLGGKLSGSCYKTNKIQNSTMNKLYKTAVKSKTTMPLIS